MPAKCVFDRWARRALWVLLMLDLALIAYGSIEHLASVISAGTVLAVAAGVGLGLLHQPHKTE